MNGKGINGVEIFVHHSFGCKKPYHRPSIECNDYDCIFHQNCGACLHKPLKLKITRNTVVCLSRKTKEDVEREKREKRERELFLLSNITRKPYGSS